MSKKYKTANKSFSELKYDIWFKSDKNWLTNKYYNEKPMMINFAVIFKNNVIWEKILISGLLSNRSIAYGIAQSCSNLGAELAFTYQDERFTERISDLSKNLQGKFAVKCNVE